MAEREGMMQVYCSNCLYHEEEAARLHVKLSEARAEIATLKSAIDAEVGYSRRREDEIERLTREIKGLKGGNDGNRSGLLD